MTATVPARRADDADVAAGTMVGMLGFLAGGQGNASRLSFGFVWTPVCASRVAVTALPLGRAFGGGAPAVPALPLGRAFGGGRLIGRKRTGDGGGGRDGGATDSSRRHEAADIEPAVAAASERCMWRDGGGGWGNGCTDADAELLGITEE